MRTIEIWDHFLKFIGEKSAALAAYLEQGNLLHDVDFEISPLNLKVGFPATAKVFYDYLQTRETFDRLRSILAEYTGFEIEALQIETLLVDPDQVGETNFKSKAELNQEIQEQEQEQKKQELLQNPFIVQAQNLFNAKIDKVLLNEV